MCYGSGCYYEDCNGECTKRDNGPCPVDEEDRAEYEDALSMRCDEEYDRMVEEKLINAE